jgi:hypothetical protein
MFRADFPKVSLSNVQLLCASVFSPLINVSTPELAAMGFRMYDMSRHVSLSLCCTSYIPLNSLCVCVSPHIAARQRRCRYIPVEKNMRNNKQIVGGTFYCAVRVAPEKFLFYIVQSLVAKQVRTSPERNTNYAD